MKERTQFNYAQRWKIEHSREKRTLNKRKRGILSFVLLSLFGAALLALPWVWQLKLHYQLGKVEEKIVSYREVDATLQEIEMYKAEINKMDNFIRTAEGRTKNPKAIRTQIDSLLPAGTTVTFFTLQADNSVQLGLVLAGPGDVAQLWTKFRDSGLFVDFDLTTVSLTDEVKNLDLTLKMKR